MAKLIITLDGHLLSEFELDKERIIIGRKPHNDIPIDNLAISGEHAAITIFHNDAFVEDLGSTNGTLMNNQPITKHALHHGDEIEIGRYRLKYVNVEELGSKIIEAREKGAQDFEKTMILRPNQIPATLSGEKPPLRLDAPSLPLREIVRDVNKFSNNVMARHLFLSLSLSRQQGGQLDQASPETGRAALAAWWKKSMPQQPAPVMDNGSGLSRTERVTANGLAAMLQHAMQSRVAQDLLDSLPVAGMDATMRERAKTVAGQAFIKTGSLRDVTAVAGYANGASGARYIVVGIVNHPNAGAARPALDALIQWAVQER
ncbi:MAG: D-alanyl-D-alanine carboxypeptidase [Polaromonas sp.]|nr:D-alanyl-D-alanine carboxypeptidase [Polaromonas sp.]